MTLLVAFTLVAAPSAPIQVVPGKTLPGLRPIAYAPAPSGSRVVVSMEDGSVRIIDARTGATVRLLAKHPQPAYGIAWSADGRFIATGDESARVWIENALSGEKLREFRTHQRGVQRVSFNLARNLLITTGRDDAVHVLNLDSPKAKEQRIILGAGANFYGATCDPKLPFTFAVATLTAGGVRMYDSASGKVSALLTGHDSQGALAVAYNPAGTRLASAGKDSSVALYDSRSFKRIGRFHGHQDFLMDLAFSPNGRLLASSSSDRTVRVWDTKAMQKAAELPNQSFVGSPLCFTADGSTLLSVSDQGFLQINQVIPAQPALFTAPKPIQKAPVRRPAPRKRRG